MASLTEESSPDATAPPRTLDKLAAMLATAKTMILETDPERLLQFVVSQAGDAVEADRSSLFLVDQERGVVCSTIAKGREARIEIPIDRGLVGHVATTGRALMVEDAQNDPRFDRTADLETGYVTRSVLAVPVPEPNGKVLGVLQVVNARHGKFTLLDAETLEAFAAFVGAAFDRARRQVELTRTNVALHHRERQMQLLYSFERSIANHQDMKDALTPALEIVRDTLGAEGVSIFVSEKDDGALQFAWVTGGEAASLSGLSLEKDEGIASQVFSTRTPRLILSPRSEPAFSPRVERMLQMHTRDMIAVPIVSESRTEGVLEIVNKIDGTFAQADLRVAEMLATGIAKSLERKRNLEQRQQAERLSTIGRMVASIVHDFKNPLGIILGYAELLTREEAKLEDNSEASEVIMRQVNRCQRMTRDLLEYCSGKQTLEKKTVELGKMMGALRAVLAEDLARSNVQLEMELAVDGTLEADEHKLERVFSNLASNSRAAMPKGGSIRIECTGGDGMLHFRVLDTGPGLPEVVAAKLFQPFVTHGKREGTGLGLSIIKGIVEAHGGRIALGPGPGGEFLIDLPGVVKTATKPAADS